LTIRAATTTDVPALCDLMQQAQDLHASAQPEFFKPHLDAGPTSTFFTDLLANGRNLVLVAEERGAVIGYLWCEEQVRDELFYRQPGHGAYLHQISVDRKHRGGGVGTALVDQATAEMKRRGATTMGVDFWSFNERARAFFAKLGFATQREFGSRALS
jgi:ribosomal protein S18 acetylase RimI-like enzyme